MKLKKKIKKPSKTTLRNKADKLFSAKIRARGACQLCGKKDDTLQCAHIISRSNLHLRYNEKNALCLCAGDHLFWHRNPLSAIRWLQETYPDLYDYLFDEQHVLERNFDYTKVIESLKC